MEHLKPRQAYEFLQQNPDAILVDCRSEMEQAGFGDVINVLEGFEGPLDERHQRSHVSGWRKEGLPWEQP